MMISRSGLRRSVKNRIRSCSRSSEQKREEIPIPRTHFGKGMLFSFGAFLTLCRIQRNNAEQRAAAMRASGGKAETLAAPAKAATATIGREPVDKQLGAMTKFSADQGLFVAWHGSSRAICRSQFLRLRLWTQKALLEQLFEQSNAWTKTSRRRCR